MKYIAHIDESGNKQTVKEHSENTAALACDFSIEIFKDICKQIGMLHDVGKYQKTFQRRIVDGEDIRVDHSISGAEVVMSKKPITPLNLLEALCIAGHHAGLPNAGFSTKEQDTLYGRLDKDMGDYSAFREELNVEEANAARMMQLLSEGHKDIGEIIERFAFFTRYCFSCLTDADTLDTMQAMGNPAPPALKSDFKKCYEIINEKLNSFKCSTALQKARADIQEQAFLNIRENGRIYLMNMPTGSGKTLASMKCALMRVLATGKKRVIYVIPYNSIIDQTVETFEGLFGDAANILRHQSSYSYEDKEDIDEDYRKSAVYGCENWDADIIITTAVQFFESIYGNKRGKLRKLHNMADSILIFDEVHLMPVEFLQPCLRGISYIIKYLNSEAIFLTATMPDYSYYIKQYALDEINVVDLIKDRSELHHFKKNRFMDMGEVSDESLIAAVAKYPSGLIVVNSRKTAQKIYSMLTGRKYHLSTYMTVKDRCRIIAEIRRELDALNKDYPKGTEVPPERRVVVVSTSLIEAGVDLDFHAAFRELAGLDNVLQTGGRCNREGLRQEGDVFIFRRSENRAHQRREQAVLQGILNEFEDISSDEAIKSYYDRLYKSRREEITANSLGKTNDSLYDIALRSYTVKLIDSPAVSIVVNQDQASNKLLEECRYGAKNNGRRLQQYCCTVYPYELDQLVKQGVVEELRCGIHVLTNNDYYCSETGIQFQGKDIIF